MAFLKKDRPSEAIQRAAMAHGINIFYVKYMGAMDVAESKGSHVADSAMNQVLEQCKLCKKTGWKAPKAELNVTQTGLKLTDRASGKIFLDLPLRNVSYCQDDRTTNCYFVFIAREHPDAGCKCFVFKCDNQASDIMRAIGIAFKKAAEREAPRTSTPSSPKVGGGGGGASSWVGGPRGAPAGGVDEVELLRRRLQEQELENQRLRSQLSHGSSGPAPSYGASRGMGFDSNFNPAIEKPSTAPSTQPLRSAVGNGNSVRAPTGRGALPLVTADLFGAGAPATTTTAQPRSKPAAGGFGFEDSFVPPAVGGPAHSLSTSSHPVAAAAVGVPALPPAAARPNKRNENNPYARPRGAMPGTTAAPRPATQLAPVTATPQSHSTQQRNANSSQRRGLPMGALMDEFADKSESDGDDDENAEEPSADDVRAFENLEDVDDLVDQLAQQAQDTDIPYQEHHQEDEPHSAGVLLAAGSQLGTAARVEVAANGGGVSESESEPHEQEEESEQEPESAEGGSPSDWRGSEHVELVPLCHHVWSMARVSEDGTVDGEQLRQLMMMTGLPTDVLFTIWGMVDVEQAGKLDYRQFGYLMGLMGQAQNNEPLNMEAVGPDSKSPHLEGLQAI